MTIAWKIIFNLSVMPYVINKNMKRNKLIQNVLKKKTF